MDQWKCRDEVTISQSPSYQWQNRLEGWSGLFLVLIPTVCGFAGQQLVNDTADDGQCSTHCVINSTITAGHSGEADSNGAGRGKLNKCLKGEISARLWGKSSQWNTVTYKHMPQPYQTTKPCWVKCPTRVLHHSVNLHSKYLIAYLVTEVRFCCFKIVCVCF